MNSQPKVYIVILNWNGLKDTLECLESVFRHDYSNFEVIVVDNGSTDNSVVVIEKTYPQVTLLRNKDNLGYTGGNNIAMKYAMEHGADYVWLLNNDTVVAPDTLSEIVNGAGKCPDIGLVSPVIYHYDEPEKIQFCGSYINWKYYGIPHAKDIAEWREIKGNQFFSLWGTALLIKCNVIKNVGYLNAKYFAYHEDNEYCIRAAKANYKIILEQSAKVYHKNSRSTGNPTAPLQVFLRVRNIYFLWMDNLKGIEKASYLKKYLAYSISYGGSLRKEKSDTSADACLDGAWAAIRGLGGPWDKNTKMPSFLKRILSWHPYFWANLLRGDISYLTSEVFKRTRSKILRITG